MKLYNCFSKEEKELQNLNLKSLTVKKLVSLSRKIKTDYLHYCTLEDESLVVSALTQIAEELGKRLMPDG